MAQAKTHQAARTPQQLAEAQALAQAQVDEAIHGLLAIANDPDAPATARVTAYAQVLDRVLGRSGPTPHAAAQVDPMVLLDDAQRQAANARLLADLRQAVGETPIHAEP